MAGAAADSVPAPGSPRQHAATVISWNMHGGLVAPQNPKPVGSLGGVKDKEALFASLMSGDKRPTVLMGQETEVSSDADQQHVTNMFDALGYHTYHSIKRKRPGQRKTASGVLVVLDKDTFKDHEVLGVVDIIDGKAMAVEVQTAEGDRVTFISVHGPDAGGGSWDTRSGFWAEIQMYATAQSRSTNGQPVVIGGDFNIWLDVLGSPTTKSFLGGRAACRFVRPHSGAESMDPSRLDPAHCMDSFPMNSSTLPCSAAESLWGQGVDPACLRSDHLPVTLTLPLAKTTRAALSRAPFSHVVGRLKRIDVSNPRMQAVHDSLSHKILSGRAGAALSEWAPTTQEVTQHLMITQQVAEVFRLLHDYRDDVQRVVGTVEERDLAFPYGDPLEDQKEMTLALGAASAMARRRSALLKLDSAVRGMHSHEVKSVVEHLLTVNPAFRSRSVADIEHELDRQVRELQNKAAHVRRRLTQSRRISIKDYWPSHSEQLTLRWIAIKGAVDVHSCAASGLWSVKDPDGVLATVTDAAQVLEQVQSYWQSLYTPRDVDLPWFAEQVRKHVPKDVPPQD